VWPVDGVLQEAAAVSRRHGGMRDAPSFGPGADQARPYRAADACELCEGLRRARRTMLQMERPSARRSRDRACGSFRSRRPRARPRSCCSVRVICSFVSGHSSSLRCAPTSAEVGLAAATGVEGLKRCSRRHMNCEGLMRNGGAVDLENPCSGSHQGQRVPRQHAGQHDLHPTANRTPDFS
jgi:hypothetical protein